ncbi:hypothetical protein FSHL1_010245 [Fusarium sambucinum]
MVPKIFTIYLALAVSVTAASVEQRAPSGCWPWGIQINPRTRPSSPSAIAPLTNQSFIISQCDILAGQDFAYAGYDLCSIDGGWESSTTDKNGRIIYDTSRFDIPALGKHLHSNDLKLGLYTSPQIPCEAGEKLIYGTKIKISTILIQGLPSDSGNCYFNYSHPDTQLYYDSLIDLWASWGADMIKLDFITPGSIVGSKPIPDDTSGAAIAMHNAIANNGKRIRLDVSSNVCRNSPYTEIWDKNTDTMRVAVDINNNNSKSFIGMWKVQGTIEQYRLFINQIVEGKKLMRTRPDFDNLFVANPEAISGINDNQRLTVMSHWIGASANLIMGSDLTNIDDLGRKLLTSPGTIRARDFCTKWPMQPRNPGTGRNTAQQLQAWVAGPSDNGQAYLLMTNLGPNHGRGNFDTVGEGVQRLSTTLGQLGFRSPKYSLTQVWSGNTSTKGLNDKITLDLDNGQLVFFQVAPI